MIAVTLAAFCGMTAPAVAQHTMRGMSHSDRPVRQGLSPLDKSFMKDTAQSNLGELKYAPIVEKIAQRPQSRQFAQKMVQDHSRAQRELEALAARTGYQLPRSTDKEEMEILRRLSRESKANFDAAYKHEMIRDHTGDIAKTRREISLGRDKAVKAYAAKMLPVLEGHLNMARALPKPHHSM